MRFLVFGAGAIGTYIGGSLVLAGQAVVFLERADVAEELSRRGLSLQLKGGEKRIPEPQMAASIQAALDRGPFDAAVFAVKSFDTLPVLDTLAPYQENLPPLLCLQNGVENEPAIAARLGPQRVIAGTVTTAIGRERAGGIRLERLRGVGVASGHPISAALVERFNAAGLNAQLFPDAAAMKWSKMVTNLVANASSAILDMPPSQILADRRLYALEIAQLREALRVMAACRIRVVDLPGTPVRLLAAAVRALPAALSQPILVRALGRGRGGKMPSFHIDLHGGRGRSEVDALNGAVVRAAGRQGIPAPVNRFFNETLLELAAGDIPLDTYARHPDKLLDRFRHG